MRVMQIISTILLSTIIAIQAHAQPIPSTPYIWKNVKVGGGGFIPGIVFSRVEKGLAYLRSDMGGAYRWDDKLQRWIPLQDGMAESSYFGVESIAPDPVDANVVYMACGMYRNDPAAILRSADRGATWEINPVAFKMGGNEDGRGMGERLAVDPNDNRILFFASRHDGLLKSADKGKTWAKVEPFPLKGLGDARGAHAGLSFVVFDAGKTSSASVRERGDRPQPTRTIFVGSADLGPAHLFRSNDAGTTWEPVNGGPAANLIPAKAEMDDRGNVYIAYGDGPGPNGVTDGAVYRYEPRTGTWTDLSPHHQKGQEQRQPACGYFGISLDRQHPGTIAVATMNRWGAGDTVFRSTDDGATWVDIAPNADRDVSATPFLFWNQPKPRLGWWMSALAIDPFDSEHVAYATGATIYATEDFSNVSKDVATHWKPWSEGIEQTAIITLHSPGDGPHLFSGFGDISGFAHLDVETSPMMFSDPTFNNTDSIETAGRSPLRVTRTGTPHDNGPTMALSYDGGVKWKAIRLPTTVPATAATSQRVMQRSGSAGVASLVLSADGKTLIACRPGLVTMRSTDDGGSWEEVTGLPAGLSVVADRVKPQRFYAMDFRGASFYTSSDRGKTFTMSSWLDAPRPAEAPNCLVATPGKEGDLWFVSRAGLMHSTDGAASFQKVESSIHVQWLSLGKAPPGKDYPALFAIGTLSQPRAMDDGKNVQVRAVWRSDDVGKTWLRVNDETTEWGRRFRCIAADPRVFGRVYVGTDGRGIFYGEPAK